MSSTEHKKETMSRSEEPIVKYKTMKYSTSIDRVEAIKETDHFLTFVDRWWRAHREAKHSDYINYYDTWEEAQGALLTRNEQKLIYARKNVRRLELEQQILQNMEKPDGE